MNFIYQERPFRTRNADEFELDQILNLFVSPIDGLATPFDYENNIIKGRMGSGKTMFLRANHAYHLYGILPALIDNTELILPVLIRLSDFQQLSAPQDIYRAIIIKIIEELSSIYLQLQDVRHLARIHLGIQRIPQDLFQVKKMSATLGQLRKLGAEQYVTRITQQLSLGGSVKPKFFEASSKYKKEHFEEIQSKPNPGIKDVEECYKTLLEDQQGKILLLIDEAGALDRGFFRSESNDSLFEILMNQLRTAPYIRTKIAIYPNSYQDILTETRYGDVVLLGESIHSFQSFSKLRRKALEIIRRYINTGDSVKYQPDQIFDLSNTDYGDGLEQLLFASGGNLRRLIQLFDIVMEIAYAEHHGSGKVRLAHAWEALQRQAHGIEGSYTALERDYLEKIATACKNRKTYRFRYTYNSPTLNKYTSKSQEYNLLNVVELGTGRRGTTYAFDYAYCVAHEIPTHYYSGTEKISRSRSLVDGIWISRLANISDQTLKETATIDKLVGEIVFYKDGRGFIKSKDGGEYFFWQNLVVESDKNNISEKKEVRFSPFKYEDNSVALNVEVLS
jgi:hypothetical protein